MKPRLGRTLFYSLVTALPIAAILGHLYFEGHWDPTERLSLGTFWRQESQREHVARYEWAKQFCHGKTVADIASGTGYGMAILSTVATSVDGYDREPLGQEFVVDLNRQGWTKHYDVIVSFETIEHLEEPEKFLENARVTCQLLLLSTPVNERPGHNPYHRHVWAFPQLQELMEPYFECQFFSQTKSLISPGIPQTTAVAVCVPRGR